MAQEIDLAYAAGLMDGEGSVTMVRAHRAGYRIPTVSVQSTTYELISFLLETYGGRVYPRKRYQAHHKTAWEWRLRGDEALRFLRLVTPFMREPAKVARAKLLIGSYKFYTPRNGKYSEFAARAKREFEQEFMGYPLIYGDEIGSTCRVGFQTRHVRPSYWAKQSKWQRLCQ